MGSDVVVTVIHIEVLKNDVVATHNDGGASYDDVRVMENCVGVGEFDGEVSQNRQCSNGYQRWGNEDRRWSKGDRRWSNGGRRWSNGIDVGVTDDRRWGRGDRS